MLTKDIIEAEVLQAQEPKGDAIGEFLAAQKPLEPEFAAVMQQCLDETLSEAPDAAPQPPEPCQCDKLRAEVERLMTICADKDWYGIDALQAMVSAQSAEIELLNGDVSVFQAEYVKECELNIKHEATIAQQAERIAELEKVAKAYEDQVAAHNKTLDEVARLSAMIEKCEKFAADIPRNGSLLGFVSESARLDVLAAITKYKKVT